MENNIIETENIRFPNKNINVLLKKKIKFGICEKLQKCNYDRFVIKKRYSFSLITFFPFNLALITELATIESF